MDDLPQTAENDIPDFLKTPEVVAVKGPELGELLALAESHDIGREQLLVAARHYHHIEQLDQLSGAQIQDLLHRMEEKHGTPEAAKANGKKAGGSIRARPKSENYRWLIRPPRGRFFLFRVARGRGKTPGRGREG